MNSLLLRPIFLRNLHRNIFSNKKALITPLSPFSRQFASKPNDKEDLEKPVDFLQSPAAKWKSEFVRSQAPDNTPWQQMWSILFSVTVFMLYFCVFREENDIDEKISQPLYDTVPQLEAGNLLALHKYNADNAKNNKDVENRMRELGMNVEAIRNSYLQQ